MIWKYVKKRKIFLIQTLGIIFANLLSKKLK